MLIIEIFTSTIIISISNIMQQIFFHCSICYSYSDSTLEIDLSMVPDCNRSDGSDYECVLDLMVENMGRNNFGKPHQFDQKKGIWEGPVLLDDVPLLDWEIIPLEFKGEWVSRYQ